jgi:hypothetical protein
MTDVANLVINDDTVTIAMSAAEKAEALHRDLTFPRSAVTGVRAVDDGMAEVHGIRMPGAYFPDVIMVGTWRSGAGNTFAVCHGSGPAIVIDLSGQHYDRIVLTVDNPQDAVTSLS